MHHRPPGWVDCHAGKGACAAPLCTASQRWLAGQHRRKCHRRPCACIEHIVAGRRLIRRLHCWRLDGRLASLRRTIHRHDVLTLHAVRAAHHQAFHGQSGKVRNVITAEPTRHFADARALWASGHTCTRRPTTHDVATDRADAVKMIGQHIVTLQTICAARLASLLYSTR